MKVLQVYFRVVDRGGERVGVNLAGGLEGRGHQISTVGFARRSEPTGPTRDWLILGRCGLSGTVTAAIGFLRLLLNERPRVVLFHTTAAALICAPIATIARIPARVVLHHNPLGETQGPFWVFVERIWGSIGFYSAVVFVSDVGRRGVAGFPRQYRDRVSVIQNGVDPPPRHDRAESRQMFGLADDEVAIVSVGALVEQKNHEVLLEATENIPATVLIAGTGHLEDELGRLASKRSAPTHLLGELDHAQVDHLLTAADIFAFPSLHEGRSLALIEASLAGLAIVCSDIPANREALGPAACYVDPADTAGWTSHLSDLVNSRSDREGLAGCGDTGDFTTSAEMITEYESLFMSL